MKRALEVKQKFFFLVSKVFSFKNTKETREVRPVFKKDDKTDKEN